jgi:hypothetical protein
MSQRRHDLHLLVAESRKRGGQREPKLLATLEADDAEAKRLEADQ